MRRRFFMRWAFYRMYNEKSTVRTSFRLEIVS